MKMLQPSPEETAANVSQAVVRKFEYIDAMRGVAVLLVVLAHTPVPSALAVLNRAGAYGVQLFFVVSAFTLFLSSASRIGRDEMPIAFFFIRRFFRIAPAFYLAGVFYLWKDGFAPHPWAPDGIHAWQIVATALFVHGWFPLAMNSIVPGGWSIAVEMNFYLFVPACFLLITNAYRAFALSAALALLAVVANALLLPLFLSGQAQHPTVLGWFPKLWFPAQACVFPIGFALFFFCNRKTGNMRSDRKTWTVILLGAISTVVLWKLHLAQSLLPVAFVIGMFVYATAVFKPWFLVNPVVQHIGKISFSVYLLHFWILDIVRDRIAPVWQAANPYIGALCFFSSVVLLTSIVASLTYRFIEVSGQSIGAAIIKGITIRRAQPA